MSELIVTAKDRVALVIGGSSGIGAATARLLAAEGARMVIAAPEAPAQMHALCEGIELAGGKAIAMHCDVTDRRSVQALFDSVIAQFGRIDVAVNSAGVFSPTPAFDADSERIDALVHVNLLGGINVIHAALKAMKPTGGVIVTVTSTQAVRAEPGCAVYAATKAGLAHFVASLAPELKNSGIRVVCVAPGGTRTPMTAAFHESTRAQSLELPERLNRTHGGPYGEFFLEPEHVAQVIAFAASDAARAIQATTLVADQGHTSALPGLPELSLTGA
jgi:3-oxoacyl-[acyl-carrier protein] reductase